MYQQQRKSWTACIRPVSVSNALRTFPKKCTRDESSRVVCKYIYWHTKHTYTNEENHEKYAYSQWDRAMHCAHFQRSVREMSLVVLYVYLHIHKHTYTNEENHEKYAYGQWEWATYRAHFQRSVREMSLVVLYVCIFTYVWTVRVSNVSRTPSFFLSFFQRSVRKISLVMSSGSSSWSIPWNVCMRSFDSENHTQFWRMHAELV